MQVDTDPLSLQIIVRFPKQWYESFGLRLLARIAGIIILSFELLGKQNIEGIICSHSHSDGTKI